MTLAEQIQIVEDNLNEYGVCDITIEEFNYLKDELYSSGCLAGIELGKLDGAREFAEWFEDNDLEFRCSGCKFKKECESESADNTNITCVEFILAEWQKGAENDNS